MSRFTYLSRSGERFYPHLIRDRLGRRLLVMRKDPRGALRRLPGGYEVRENVHNQVSVRRIRSSSIRHEEEALVRSCLSRLKPLAHAVDAGDRSITIYASSLDRKCFSGSLDAEFAEGFASALDDALRRRYGGELVELFRARRRAIKHGRAKYYPLLRFRLKDRRRRTFQVERVCFSGDKSWLALSTMSLPAALMKYVPHIGKETFFVLI